MPPALIAEWLMTSLTPDLLPYFCLYDCFLDLPFNDISLIVASNLCDNSSAHSLVYICCLVLHKNKSDPVRPPGFYLMLQN